VRLDGWRGYGHYVFFLWCVVGIVHMEFVGCEIAMCADCKTDFGLKHTCMGFMIFCVSRMAKEAL